MSWNRHQFSSNDAAQLTTLLNTEFDAAKDALGSGGSGVGFEFFGSGRVVFSLTDALLPHPTLAPSLAVEVPSGTILRIDSAIYVLEEDVLFTGTPPNFAGYCVPSVAFDEDSQANLWFAQWLVDRPALGSGTLCYVETDADGVTLLDASENKADVINALPLLEARLRLLEQTRGGGGGEGGTSYWAALTKTSVDPTTILQAIDAAIAGHVAALHTGGGLSLIPPEARDEIAVGLLDALYLHEVAHDNAFDIAPLYRTLVVSPGRGHNKETDARSVIDYEYTTLPIDEINCQFG